MSCFAAINGLRTSAGPGSVADCQLHRPYSPLLFCLAFGSYGCASAFTLPFKINVTSLLIFTLELVILLTSFGVCGHTKTDCFALALVGCRRDEIFR